MKFRYWPNRDNSALLPGISSGVTAPRGPNAKFARRLKQLIASGVGIAALASSNAAYADGTVVVGGGAPVAFDANTDPLFGNLAVDVDKHVTVESNQNTGIINWTYPNAANATVTVNAGATIAPAFSYTPGIGGAYGVEVWAWTARVDVNHNGRIVQPFGNGIDLISGFGGSVPGSDVILRGSGSVEAGFIGVQMASNAGNINYSLTGAIRSGGAGIYAYSIGNGNITLDGGGTGTINASNSIAGQDGIDVRTNGAINVRNFASITGAGTGLYFNSAAGAFGVVAATGAPVIMGAGNINVAGVGPITSTTEWGVYGATTTGNQTYVMNGAINANTSGMAVYSTTGGALNITTNAAVNSNGVLAAGLSNSLLSAGGHGIYASTFFGGGNISITNNAAVRSNGVTAGMAGITSVNGSGTSLINANANVTGASAGIYTVSGGGVSTVNIASAAQVYGNTYGLYNQGGNHVTNNAGLITTTPNVGLALGSTGPSQASGLFAYSAWGAVTSTVNNTGTITGGLYSDTGATTINHRASGIMNLLAGFANQTTTGMTINNQGLVNSYAGATTLLGNRFNNMSGGIIDLTKNAALTDSLIVQNFSAQTGSRVRLNLNVNAALGMEDRGTTGNSDTIFVVGGVSAPQTGSFVDFTQAGGDATALTGSVALVYTGRALAAPTPGAQLVQSSNYLFGALNPSTGARIYKIVDDGQGGAYLQWVPNISSATMGAFMGGDLSTKDGRNSALAAGGGAISGATGAAGHVADNSASDAGGQCLTSGPRRNLWAHSNIDQTDFSGGDGSSQGVAIGFEAPISRKGADECAQTALGWFGYANWGKTDFATGNSKGDGYGVGGYIRTARANGFYANLLGTAGAVNGHVSNNIFRSTADQNAFAWMVNGTVGFTKPMGEKGRFDLRGSVARTVIDYNRFVDSMGFIVQDMTSKSWTAEGTVGLSSKFGENTVGFIRGGAKWIDLTRATSAYDIVNSGSSDTILGTAEIGLNANLSNTVRAGLAGNGDFASGYTRYGGRVYLLVAF